MNQRRKTVLAATALVVLSAGLWWGWFGWDTQRDIDPATGASSGPYEWWQICACIVSWAVIAWAGTELLEPAVVIFLMPAAFTASWILSSALTDDSGLWAIGAVLVAAGTLAANALFVGLLRLLFRKRNRSGARKDPALP
ncbi:hypothetical protein [Arthrobacter caoxuetaonis]|uniref:Uncharacterized protein n=1 Tax=Arthrobacter caoxuetaonis TaxID=2886935 RepID=A0A9X1MFU1_9MICC|nr:hypothetical protein [Arthrobacter caoxuetaonis]MCC3298425.1 hypothetical protein [Arthrobacter caoxuetaonis]USQ57559.1 hypothetical protein NF551_01465 [Arthrobacter caoxuetaonis]